MMVIIISIIILSVIFLSIKTFENFEDKTCPIDYSQNLGADYIVLNNAGETYLYNISNLNESDLYLRQEPSSNDYKDYGFMLNKLIRKNINPTNGKLLDNPRKNIPITTTSSKQINKYSFFYRNGVLIYIVSLVFLVIIGIIYFFNSNQN